MNKLLTLAAAGLLSLAAAPQAAAYDYFINQGEALTPTSQLENNKYYLIYDAHGDDGTENEAEGGDDCRYAFRYDNGAGELHGTHIKPVNVKALSTVHIWQATTTDNGSTWRFQNYATGNYIKTATHNARIATTTTESEIGNFAVVAKDGETTTFNVGNSASTSDTHWDGNGGGTYPMVGWNGSGHDIRFYEIDPESESIVLGNSFRLVSARYTTRWAKTQDGGMTTEELALSSAANAEVFVEVPSGNSIKIFSVVGGGWAKACTNNSTATQISADAADACEYTVSKIATGAEKIWITDGSVGFNIQNNNVAGWSGFDIGSHWFMVYDVESYTTNFPCYAATSGQYETKIASAKSLLQEAANDTDAATSEQYTALQSAIAAAEAARFGVKAEKTIPQLLEELVAAQNALNAILVDPESYKAVKAQGDAFVALGLADEAAQTAWTNASNITDDNLMTGAAINELKSAFSTLVAAASLTADNVYVQFKHSQREAYLGNNNGVLNRGAAEGTRTFTLKQAEGGFYLFNEYSNAYVKHPAGDNVNISLVATQAEASVYTFDVHNSLTGLYGIKVNNTGVDASVGTDRLYLHSNNANGDVTTVVRWEAGDNSSWYISAASEDMAATENLNGAVASYNNWSSRIGTGVGTYSFTGDADAMNSAKEVANNSDATNAQKREAAATLFSAQFALNMPEAGRYYRFKGINSEAKYMSSTSTTANRIDMVADANGNSPETVFYYDGERLIALTNGLVLGKFNNSSSNWCNVISTADGAGTVTFGAAATAGRYTISPTSGRYIYNQNALVDAGGDPSGAGYHWDISQVDWLPIPGSDQAYTTIHSPVALNIKPNMAIYDVTVVGAKAKAKVREGNIPANTPVLIELLDGVERDGNNNLAYLQVDYSAAQAQDETAANATFAGSVFATAQAEGTSYFTVQLQDEAINFHPLAADANVPGFAAHIEVPADSAETFYTIDKSNDPVDSINEINLDERNGADMIFDLQGRRVNKAANGVFIINGKKVLVK